MRNIKFRAWDKKKKEMLSDGIEHELRVLSEPSEFTNKTLISPSICKRFILMQYTGLKDKNGKEIYEGDIIKFRDYGDKILEVVFDEYDDAEGYCVFNHLGWVAKWKETTDTLPDVHKICSIIGNVYENPDLLEGNKQ